MVAVRFAATQHARPLVYVVGGALLLWIGFLAVAGIVSPDRPRGPVDLGILIGITLGLAAALAAVVVHA